MKNTNVFLLFLASILVLSACQSLEKVLPKDDASWNLVKETINEYEDGVATVTDSVTVYTDPIVYKFNEDGTGTYTEGTDTETFNWTYDEDAEILTLEEGGFALPFEVREWSKTRMELFTDLEIEFLGSTFLTEVLFEFEKAE